MPEDELIIKLRLQPLADTPLDEAAASPAQTPELGVDNEVTRILPAASPAAPAAPAATAAAAAAAAETERIPLISPGTPAPAPAPVAAEGAGFDPEPPPDTDFPKTLIVASQTLPGTTQSGAPALRQVGRYVIQERIGRGGMATVFRAHDPQIDRDVAIKFLHASLCEDPEYRSRFLREARAAGGLSHPNIVTVHDVGEIEGRPYMAMELVDGAPLSDEMAAGQPMPVRNVVIMGIQLARALAYAHDRGIVHRDIKPGNLMRLKGTQTIKVTDFGIAHMESAGSEHRTRVGDILGTPQYMSPEQAQGERLDGRSDLFSTGILLYQMLTGQRPFLGDSLVALAVKIARDEPIPIEQLRPDLPAALRRVVERCLAKSPDRRFQTGAELAEALARVLAGIDEAERAEGQSNIVPLRVKWAGMMALIVAVVMAVTASFVSQRQHAAMEQQVVQSGAAMARFIAAQNAIAALSEDWVSVEVALQETMKTGDFQSITVIDREGIVRASSQGDLVGQAYQAPAFRSLEGATRGVPVTRYTAAGEAVLGFEAPITFQAKRVGGVALGLREQPLLEVARLSMGLMAVLVVVTVLAVAVAMFFVANWFAQPIKLIGESMAEIAKGRFDHRIREHRKDEFGQLYAAFDRMAQALQDRQAAAGVDTASAAPGLAPDAPLPVPGTAADAAGAAAADEGLQSALDPPGSNLASPVARGPGAEA